ncbi:MAG: hypothetical protein A2V83_08955 [Nitrospirae bacterium RBG_16_64_22]|nr:MAG: hypothetical protein A2V83_08955 [Nitrospirae bacterium RBG_16_64_22]
MEIDQATYCLTCDLLFAREKKFCRICGGALTEAASPSPLASCPVCDLYYASPPATCVHCQGEVHPVPVPAIAETPGAEIAETTRAMELPAEALAERTVAIPFATPSPQPETAPSEAHPADEASATVIMRRPEEATVVMQARRDIEEPPPPASRSEEATVLISRPTPQSAQPAAHRREEAGATRIMAAPAAPAKAGAFPWKIAVAGGGAVIILLAGGWWMISSRPAKTAPAPSSPPVEVKAVEPPPSPAPVIAQIKNPEAEYERLNAEGIRLAQEGKMDEALSAFRSAVRAKPDGYKAYVNIAVAYRKLAMNAEAKEAYQKAIEINPKNGTPYKYLAKLFEDEGNASEAVRFYQAYVEVDPNAPDVASIRSRIRVLKTAGR